MPSNIILDVFSRKSGVTEQTKEESDVSIQRATLLGYSCYIQQSQDLCAQGCTRCSIIVLPPRLFIGIRGTYTIEVLMVLLIRCLQVASNPEIDLGDDDDPIR
jgi:hypothetical protein